jgi:hypothetical protein
LYVNVILTILECFYANQSQKYAGFVHVDKENKTCHSWTNYVKHTGDTKVNFPNNSVADAKNYCRDPKNSGKPQCYNGINLKECDVPQCPRKFLLIAFNVMHLVS